MTQEYEPKRLAMKQYNREREIRYGQLFEQRNKPGVLGRAEQELTDYWLSILQQPDWYIPLKPFLNDWMLTYVHDDPKTEFMRKPFVTLIGNMLENNQIPLGVSGPNFDARRQKRIEQGLPAVEQVIIHHSETDAGPDEQGSYDLTEEAKKLNAYGFVRQFTEYFMSEKKSDGTANEWYGKPVWSGHFDEQGKQVFYAYNALVTPDGTMKSLVSNRNYTLWHAGGAANTNSAAIVALGNYEHTTPPEKQLVTLALTINQKYGDIDPAMIRGHNEVNSTKTCPGENFLGTNGWKEELQTKVRDLRV